MFPLPGWLVWILKAPMRMIVRKDRPERRREVAWVVLTYTLIFMGLSLFWVDFGRARSRQEQMAIENPQKMIDSLLAEIKQTESRRKVSGHFTSFRPLGDAAVDPMIKMLSDDWEVNREYAAMILGDIPSQRAVPHLILALDDPDQRVRRKAVFILLQYPDARAIPYFERMLDDEDFETRFFARQAIRQIDHQVDTAN